MIGIEKNEYEFFDWRDQCMKKIYSERQTGKTTELIKIAAREHIPIVVFTHKSKEFIIKRINEMYKMKEIEYTPDVIVCDGVRGYKSQHVNYNNFKCVVDDAEYVLGKLLNAEIVALSMNKNT